MNPSDDNNRAIARAVKDINQGEYEKATEALLPLALAGDAEAQFYLGDMHFQGAGISADVAHKWILKASEQNHPEACYRLACLGSFWKTGQEQVQLLTRAADLGSVSAAFALGVYYATGDWAGPKDLFAARKWYEKAAQAGHADAEYNLAFMILLGEGGNPCANAAEEWLDRAALQGHSDARRLLAELYETGRYGFRIDKDRASYWRSQ